MYGEADGLFLDRGYIAVGWPALGNLGQIGKDRELLKEQVRRAYPDYKPGKVPVVAGMLVRFVTEMRPGEYVVYPRKADRTLRLGRIKGEYEYRSDLDDHYCNVRAVEWIADRPRTAFRQTALYELGSALTLFQVREHADHVLEVFGGKVKEEEPEPALPDPEESTEDFIVRRLENSMKGAPLERFVKDLLEAMGYRCRLTKTTGDGGIDVQASRGPLGFEPPIVKAQVKSTTGNIGDADVKHLYASVNSGEYALFVSLGGFTKAAVDFASAKPNISLVGGKEFVSLILDHYDSLSPASKAYIPLRRSFVPDAGSD